MGPVGASLSRRCGRPLGVGFFAVPRWHCCFPHPAAGSRINGLPWLQFLAEKCERVNAMASSGHTPLPPWVAPPTRPPGGAHGWPGDRLSPGP